MNEPNRAPELEGGICDLKHLKVNVEPFPYVTHDHFIRPQYYQQLSQSFPTCPPSSGPSGFSLYWGDDDYQRLLDESPAWLALFKAFHSQMFIDWCRDQFAAIWQREGCQINLAEARYVPYREDRIDKERSTLRRIEHEPHELWVRMDIHQGRKGYARRIHLDHARRLLSMLVYLCDHTENQMAGGELFLHTGDQQHSHHPPPVRITPRHNLMVAFPCMRRSYHSVSKISSTLLPRNYIQVHISSSVDIWEPRKMGSERRPKKMAVGYTGLRPQTLQANSSLATMPHTDLETSRVKLLNALAGATDITLIRNPGNMGDHLIHAGTRRLLADLAYREVSLLNVEGVRGELGIIVGSGAWCRAYNHLTKYLPRIERQFERVVIFPSSFDIADKSVRQVLTQTKALVFARERSSYQQILALCQSDLAHDCALFFDYTPYRGQSQAALLTAYRTDPEAAGRPIPEGNDDISVTCESLDEFLWTISRHEIIETDRAHVMIAAAQLGKRVYYNSSNYHKVPALAEFNLPDYPLIRLGESRDAIFKEQLLCEYERRSPEDGPALYRTLRVPAPVLSAKTLGQQVIQRMRAIPRRLRPRLKQYLARFL
jgi:exopolysaccharide biosynthesis predicted pyruvyltransferase EpsI